MTALIIDRSHAEITLSGESLSIMSGQERTTVPCARIERLIVRSPARIDTAVLDRLWTQGAGVLILSGQHAEPSARFLGRPHTDCLRRVAQLRLQMPCEARLEIAREIILRKLDAQSAALVQMASKRRSMAWAVLSFHECMAGLRGGLERETDLDCIKGVGGASAAAYYVALEEAFAPVLGFRGRCLQLPTDPVNASLSMGYTLLTFEAARQAQIAGLDPMLGVIHEPAFGRESLACDLIEPLQPHLDLMVFECFAGGTLRADHFRRDMWGQCLMNKGGRKVLYETIEQHMPLWSRWLRRAVRTYVRMLPTEPFDVWETRPTAPTERGGTTVH